MLKNKVNSKWLEKLNICNKITNFIKKLTKFKSLKVLRVVWKKKNCIEDSQNKYKYKCM